MKKNKDQYVTVRIPKELADSIDEIINSRNLVIGPEPKL
jgi:hypothetical protein